MEIVNFISMILSEPAIILGLVAALGLIALHKSFSDILIGTIKTILGFLILTGGSGIIVNALIPFSTMFQEAFHLTGIVAEDNSLVAAVSSFLGSQTAMIMVFAFLINLILARITPYKYVFLTGHMIWSFAGTMAILFDQMGFAGWKLVLLGSIVEGVCMVIFPAISQPTVRKVTGSDEVAFGFWGSSWITLSAWVGKFFGNPDESAEEINVPKGLDFFRDMSIFMSIVMVIIYVVTALFAGPEIGSKLSGNQNYIIYSVIQALTFVAGVLVLLQGVRMFLGEIIPAFKGISEYIVPGAKPALDVPIFYSYSPTAVVLGFISAVIGSLIATFLTRFIAPVVVLPSVIGMFFMGAAAGVFGNILGGRKASLVAGFFLGFTWPLMVAFAYPLLDVTKYGVQGLWFASPDAILVVVIIKCLGKLFGI
nr:PTS ascorbate transporter subunit IIC [Tepidanaerobacter syntrophicus]